MTMERTIRTHLGDRSYDVVIAPGAIRQAGAMIARLPRARAGVVISDSNVAELFGRQLTDSLTSAGLSATLLEFPAGEQNKTLSTYGQLFDRLLAWQPPIDRDCIIVALGGGVVGDLAGFVAATALRGLRWLGCPTTLLADVDASVGGKTAIDHRAGKNLIGAFYQPIGVLIDVDTLKVLPIEYLRDGLAECVKHGVIRDEALLGFIENHAEAILACEADDMCELIARNVEIKAAVVSADEFESGQRADLNFGHTVGHAIEIIGGYGVIPHGQAVSLGMTAEFNIAVARGLVDQSAADRVRLLLDRLGLPTTHSGLDAAEIWRIMQHDKKVRGGKVRIVLPRTLGEVDVYDDLTVDEVRRALEALGHYCN